MKQRRQNVSPVVKQTSVNVGNGVDLWITSSLVEKPRAIVIIVHGLCEHAGRYDAVVERLNASGYSVYRFDNRGHGRSGGARGFIENYLDFIDDADKVVGMAKQDNPRVPAFMLGHSMGGFITAAYGVSHPGRLSGQILSGAAVIVLPLFKDLESFDYNADPLAPIPNSLSSLISRDPGVVKAYAADPLVLKEFTTKMMGEVFLSGAKWLMENMGAYTYPCLILHGGDDQIVPADASRYFYEHIGSTDKQLKIYDGLYHEILNEPEKETVIQDIRAWIEARI